MTQKTKMISRSLKVKTLFAATALTAMTATSLPAFAEEGESSFPGEFSTNVALSTNYIYRGITQTDDGPAFSGGFDYAVDIFYIGTWASNVEWDGTSLEIDYYAGLTPSAGAFDFDIGILYYAYPDSPDMPEQDFYEFYGGVSTTLYEDIEVGLKFSYSPDFYGETGEAYYPEFNVGFSFLEDWSLSAHIGQQLFEDDAIDEYIDWNIGVTYAAEWFDITVGYYDTTDRLGGDEDDAVVLTISKSF